MIKHIFAALAALIVLISADAAWAQDEEIVVTASRRAASYQALVPPTASVKRRADFAVAALQIRNDTRDQSQRLSEMREALRALHARARPGAVTLAIVDEDVGIVRPFSLAAAEDLIRADRRPDTSTITVRLRTPIAENDTLESVQQRVGAYVAQAPKPGRTEMEIGESQLTMVGVDRYREQLLQAIAQDGRQAAALFGDGYAVSVSGLESQVAWLRTGDLELTLFIPYALTVESAN